MKPKELSELLRCAFRDHPRASEAELKNVCRGKCLGDQGLNNALFDYWWSNSRRDFSVIGGSNFSTAIISNRQQRASTKRAIKERTQKLIACLMDYALSDGTLLRFATFGQCGREGGWLCEIARHGKANEIVGKKLTETDVQNIRQRYAPPQRAKAA